MKAGKVRPSDLAGVDIIFAAGGDGTFLRAAQAVCGDIPVLGVNTDPSLSQGALTCCKLDLTGGRHPEFENIIRRLHQGDFRVMYHDRLVVKIVNAEGQETILPQYVLNEVLLTVTDPAKPTVLDIGIDDVEREKIRCSGIVVWYIYIFHKFIYPSIHPSSHHPFTHSLIYLTIYNFDFNFFL